MPPVAGSLSSLAGHNPAEMESAQLRSSYTLLQCHALLQLLCSRISSRFQTIFCEDVFFLPPFGLLKHHLGWYVHPHTWKMNCEADWRTVVDG